MKLVLMIQFASTWAMVGLIWFVQVVHYPLFSMVGAAEFSRYHGTHTRCTSWIVGPPMLAEVVTAVLLVWLRPAFIPRTATGVGLLLLIAIWLSTALLQVPLHNSLSRQNDERSRRRLVQTNWLRTIAWSIRGVLVLWMVTKALR